MTIEQWTGKFGDDYHARQTVTVEQRIKHLWGPLSLCLREGPVGILEVGAGTGDNLKAAIASETHEYTDRYPGMARIARQEGFDEIADWFETLAKTGKSQAGRFRKVLDAL